MNCPNCAEYKGYGVKFCPLCGSRVNDLYTYVPQIFCSSCVPQDVQSFVAVFTPKPIFCPNCSQVNDVLGICLPADSRSQSCCSAGDNIDIGFLKQFSSDQLIPEYID